MSNSFFFYYLLGILFLNAQKELFLDISLHLAAVPSLRLALQLQQSLVYLIYPPSLGDHSLQRVFYH